MREARRFPSACVASPHYLASAAGLRVLASGGNAVDAALATNLTLGVVQPSLCGYGGDLFALVWDGAGLHGYAGAGRAPAGARLETVREAVGGSQMPEYGPLTVTVPGVVDGWFALHRRFASRPFEELARPALTYARHGFVLTGRGASLFEAPRRAYSGAWAEEWHATYGDAAPGLRLRQPSLARTIEMLCSDGPQGYYRGPVAEAIVETLQRYGSTMTPDDLARHSGKWVKPMGVTYRGTTVAELPPPTQGVTALEALGILGATELPPPGAEREHLLIEAMKLALADRDTHVTDPDHMQLAPETLISDEWTAERRARIDPERAGTPRAARPAAGDTAYLCAADAAGTCVSLIQSNFRGFGSGVQVPGWGINLHNRGAFFSLDPDHVNAVAPRKRTMHTLIPAMAFREDRPRFLFGTMGGDGQPQTHLQLVVRILDDGEDLQRAVDASRWLIDPLDWTLTAETPLEGAVVDALRRRGHAVELTSSHDNRMGHAHAIEVTEDGYLAASDPRTEGAALGL